ncbi:MAG: helix-hairpin-helix domain-containing protein [Candidatus Kryptonium sp.]
MKRLALFFLSFITVAKSQDIQIDTLKIFEEDIIENLEIDSRVDELRDQFELKMIELNKADIDDLTEFPLITRETAKRIIEYRNKIGGFKTREQVFYIPNVDENVKSFLYRNGYIQRPNVNFRIRSRVLNRNNLRNFSSNFEENFKTYQLAYFSVSNFSGGFIVEKDYGENKINELMNFYVEYKSSGKIRKIILGNYALQFGQGILLWKPIALGKGSDAISPAVRSFENYSSGYISTTEVKPLFGAVVNSKVRNFELTLFYSRTDLPSLADSLGNVKYVDFSGINKKRRTPLIRKLYGGILNFGGTNFALGILNYYEIFNRDFSLTISKPFQKKGFYNAIEFDFYFRNLNFFGEVASRAFENFSYVAGLTIGFEDLNFVFHLRNLNQNLFSINGNAFSERYGEAWNEQGFYSGVKFKVWRIGVSGYWDIFKFPKSGLDDIKNGNDYRIEANFSVSRNLIVKLMFREKARVEGIKTSDEFGRSSLGEGIERRRNLRFEVENRLGRISLRSRIEAVRRSLNNVERGILIYQGVRFEPLKNLRIYGRVMFFKTDSYFSRIYVYEDDIDGVVSLLPFYENGLRWYFVVKYRFGKILSIQLKYGETFLSYTETVRNIFGLQIELKN